MRKTLLLLLFIPLLFSSCTKDVTNSKYNVVITSFPYYDWAKNIVGDTDDINLTLLIDNGTDIHSYSPSISDMVTIKEADLFIYGGGESEEWANDIINLSNTKVLSLLDVLGDKVKVEEVIEGMQEERHEHEHGHEHEEITYDEHIWLSIKNAELFVEKIAEELSLLDKENENTYRENASNYIEALKSLDNEYEEMLNMASTTTLLFADRFPFRYFVDDYNLNYYAAFVGCSAETEASFETITFLINKVNELDLKTIFVIDGSNASIAETVKSNSINKNQNILVLNSLQSITRKNIDGGTSYLSLMRYNLGVLAMALI